MTHPFTLVAVVGFIVFSGCTRESAAQPGRTTPPTTLPILREWHEIYGRVAEKQRLVIDDPQRWTAVWTQAFSGRTPAPAVPEVDFTNHMVLAVFMGTKPTGGYDIQITRITRTEHGLDVTVRETAPPQGAMVTQALTSPFHFVVVPKAQGKVSFVE